MFKSMLVYLFGDTFKSAQEIKFEQAQEAKAIRLVLEADKKRTAIGWGHVSRRG